MTRLPPARGARPRRPLLYEVFWSVTSLALVACSSSPATPVPPTADTTATERSGLASVNLGRVPLGTWLYRTLVEPALARLP